MRLNKELWKPKGFTPEECRRNTETHLENVRNEMGDRVMLPSLEMARVREPEDVREEYVTPTQMKDDMVHLFDTQRVHERKLTLGLTQFRPEGVSCTLSSESGLIREYTEQERWNVWYREVLGVVIAYGNSCCRDGFKRDACERSKEDSLEVLDLDVIYSIWSALRVGNVRFEKLEEVYDSIKSIPVVFFREQCDRCRRRRTEDARKYVSDSDRSTKWA